jgi:hypothetical protein
MDVDARAKTALVRFFCSRHAADESTTRINISTSATVATQAIRGSTWRVSSVVGFLMLGET